MPVEGRRLLAQKPDGDEINPPPRTPPPRIVRWTKKRFFGGGAFEAGGGTAPAQKNTPFHGQKRSGVRVKLAAGEGGRGDGVKCRLGCGAVHQA